MDPDFCIAGQDDRACQRKDRGGKTENKEETLNREGLREIVGSFLLHTGAKFSAPFMEEDEYMLVKPVVRHEGEWTIPFLPRFGFRWADLYGTFFYFLPAKNFASIMEKSKY